MVGSTLRLPQISLLLIIILKASVVLSTRSGLPVVVNTYDGGFLPKRFLQNHNNNNNNNNNNANTGTYTCPTNYECQRSATAGTPLSMTLQNNSALLYVLDLSQQTSDTALTVSYSSTSTSSLITTEMALVPYQGSEYDINTPSDSTYSLVISQDLIQEYENANGAVELLVVNYSGATTTVTVEMTFADGSSSSSSGISLINIILPIAGALFIIFLLGICCHYRKKRLQQERRQRAMAARRVRGAARRAQNGEGQQDDAEEDEEEELEDPLTEGNINERFPEAQFEHFKSSFPQTTCSVCLEEFQKRVGCRQLYCEHMFHSECIRLWLVNQLKKGHAFCPNCNKDMMHKAPEVEGEVPHAEVQEQVQAQPLPGN